MSDPLSPEVCARARAERLLVDEDEMLALRADFERWQRRRDLAEMERRDAERAARVALMVPRP